MEGRPERGDRAGRGAPSQRDGGVKQKGKAQGGGEVGSHGESQSLRLVRRPSPTGR